MTFRSALTSMAFASAMTVGAAASAATFDFDFTGVNASDTNSASYTVGDLTVTVTAGTFPGANPSSINFGARRVDIDSDGLGADAFFDIDEIDGSLGNDVLVFSFSRDIEFDSIGFANVDFNDDFAFGSVAGGSFDRIVDFQDVTNPAFVADFATLAERTGSAFGIGAIGVFDNFRITGLTVSDIAPVPLPASGVLLLAALGAGAAAKRRKAKKAA